MKQQYLTPSQVEELRGLGVEFEDTACYWALSDFSDCAHLRPYEMVLQDYLNSNEILDLYTDKGIGDYDIPAPSLQEVLEKLPKILKSTIADLDMPLAISYCEVTKRWYAGYEYTGIDHGLVSAGDTPLEAVFNLAKEVATHHPESLTEKD